MSAEGFGKGSTPESKPATNRNKADDDLDRGLEILLAILLAMGYRGTHVLPMLSQAERSRVIGNLISDASAKLIATTRLLMDGRIAFRVWLIQMRDILVGSLAAGALAQAGKEELDDAEKESWISETNLQYGYLVNWYAELRDGRQGMNDAMPGRADLYARAVWAVAWRVWVAGKMSGVVRWGDVARKPWGKRVLGVAEHCHGNKGGVLGCIELADLPWMPLDEVTPIGSSICGPRCRCEILVEWR